MANQWFKFYGAEYLSDPKMDRLTVQERSCWLTLLCMASLSDGIIKYLSIESLLNKSGVHFDPYDSSEWDKAQNVLRSFEQYEMILIHKNGAIEIKNWVKRQDAYLSDAERAKNYRERKKNRHENVTADVTNVTLEENRIEENRIDNKDLFLSFWKTYPVKKAKDKAYQKWQKLDVRTQEEIINHVSERKVRDKQWISGYVPHPTTFLNGKLWEDEYEVTVGGGEVINLDNLQHVGD